MELHVIKPIKNLSPDEKSMICDKFTIKVDHDYECKNECPLKKYCLAKNKSEKLVASEEVVTIDIVE